MDAKICGVKDSKTLAYIINSSQPPKYIGFITNYTKSKRYIKYKDLKKLINIDKKKTNFVSVLVNPTEEILEKIKEIAVREHTPPNPGTYTDRTLHERDRWAKWGDSDGQPQKFSGKVNTIKHKYKIYKWTNNTLSCRSFGTSGSNKYWL